MEVEKGQQEAEKEKWLEKVRPIAKDLYESEGEDEE